jgi:uncharacterized protein with HEPN domain
MSRSPRVYLDDIVQAIADIADFTRGLTREQFLADLKTQHACIRDLEVIGEAAKHLPPDLRSRAPHVEWQKIAGLRDVLVHEYFGIDASIVWDIIATKLPELREAAEGIRRIVNSTERHPDC